MPNIQDQTQHLTLRIQKEFKSELLAAFAPVQIGNQIFEIESYQSENLQTKILRVGPLIFIEVAGNIFNEDYIDRQTLKLGIRELKDKLGTLYSENKSNILFTRPSKYLKSPLVRGLLPLSPHTILPIASMLAYPERLLGKSGIDLGAGDGILSRVALKLGASHITLVDWNDLQLDKAKGFLEEDGYLSKENNQRNSYTILRENFLDTKFLNTFPQLKNVQFGITNISPFDSDLAANSSPLNIVKELSQLNFFIYGGYQGHHMEHEAILSEIQPQIASYGYDVECHRYCCWNSAKNSTGNENKFLKQVKDSLSGINNTVATLIAIKEVNRVKL